MKRKGEMPDVIIIDRWKIVYDCVKERGSYSTGKGLYNDNHVKKLIEEVSRLEAGLIAAAMSLETIHEQAGRDEFLIHMLQVRGYANSRATVARAALTDTRKEER
jgi:hypothetical protein